MIKFTKPEDGTSKIHTHSTANFLMLKWTYPDWNLTLKDYFDYCLVEADKPFSPKTKTKNILEILYRDYWERGSKFERGEFLNFCLCELFVFQKHKSHILTQK